MEVSIFYSPHTPQKLQLQNRKYSDSIIHANFEKKEKKFASEYLHVHFRQTKYEKTDFLY